MNFSAEILFFSGPHFPAHYFIFLILNIYFPENEYFFLSLNDLTIIFFSLKNHEFFWSIKHIPFFLNCETKSPVPTNALKWVWFLSNLTVSKLSRCIYFFLSVGDTISKEKVKSRIMMTFYMFKTLVTYFESF